MDKDRPSLILIIGLGVPATVIAFGFIVLKYF